jgi:alginate O-acetyltransferase complex protein AlgI
MIFIGYDFVWFAIIFFPLYYIAHWPVARLSVLILGGIIFQVYYGGWFSFAVVGILALLTYAVSLGWRTFIGATIALCAIVLGIFKYTPFVASGVVGVAIPSVGAKLLSLAPATIPLGISFFTFEFIHYLADVRSGTPPIRRLSEYLAFVLFWPTMVAGPIKRYEQFVPSLHLSLKSPNADDAMLGLIRVALGFAKKWAADNLTAWIDFNDQFFAQFSSDKQWLFLTAIAFRILLDFSGYSDMAIGFARIMGIVVPENFNWPYLARSPIEFWQRWHISLSTWIRDYVYIPLGGNRLGLPRRMFNTLAAMSLCGLWHGPSWNFVVWGLYHGVGLSVAALFGSRLSRKPGILASPNEAKDAVALRKTPKSVWSVLSAVRDLASWACTMLFVWIGWLLFFYPIDRAWLMTRQLFAPLFR